MTKKKMKNDKKEFEKYIDKLLKENYKKFKLFDSDYESDYDLKSSDLGAYFVSDSEK